MNKFLAECRDSKGKLLARFDNDSQEFLLDYMKQKYLGKEVSITIFPTKWIEENNCEVV